jgi:FkbM family methyltransferase
LIIWPTRINHCYRKTGKASRALGSGVILPQIGDTLKRGILKILLCFAAMLLCLGVGQIFWPQLPVFVLVAAGRAPDCSTHGGMKAVERRYLYSGALERIGRQSKSGAREAGFALTETPMGQFWEPVNSVGSIVVPQLAELESKYAAGAPAPKPGDVVLDCGANIGTFTREAVRRGAKLVVAIEPMPENIECIRRNLKAEIASGRVIVYPKGVWDKDDVLTINRSNKDSAEDSFVRNDDSSPGPTLPLTTIDKVVAELHLDRIDFIKMDIEGAEPKALLGGQQVLQRFRPRLEVEVSGNAKEIRDIARRAWPGYQSECLVCLSDPRKMVNPTMIYLEP